MSRRLRILATIILLLFAVVIAQAANIQFFRSASLNANPNNPNNTDPSINYPRGEIIAANGSVLAYSVKQSDPLDPYRRVYPDGSLMSGVVGFSSPYYGELGARGRVQQLPRGACAAAPELRATALADERRGLGDPDDRPGTPTGRSNGDEGDRRRRGGARPQDRRRARDVLEPELQPRPVDVAYPRRRHRRLGPRSQARQQRLPAARVRRDRADVPARFDLQDHHDRRRRRVQAGRPDQGFRQQPRQRCLHHAAGHGQDAL